MKNVRPALFLRNSRVALLVLVSMAAFVCGRILYPCLSEVNIPRFYLFNNCTFYHIKTFPNNRNSFLDQTFYFSLCISSSIAISRSLPLSQLLSTILSLFLVCAVLFWFIALTLTINKGKMKTFSFRSAIVRSRQGKIYQNQVDINNFSLRLVDFSTVVKFLSSFSFLSVSDSRLCVSRSVS